MIKRILTFAIILCVFSTAAYAGDVKSKFDISLYGFVKFEAIYDQTEIAKGDWALYAHPDGSAQSEQDVMTMNARHSRIGIKIAGPEFGENKVNGLVEMDFAGSFPNSGTAARQPIPRLRHAWVEIVNPFWEARFGQDWALVSGPFPNTTSFVVGAGKGNLWMRYPQMKFTIKPDNFKIAVSLNRPMAGNIKYNEFDGGSFDMVGDGERTGLPWLMGRVDYSPSKNFTASLSGHYGQEQIEAINELPIDKPTYSVNADVVLKTGNFSITASGFYGENLNSFFGGIFQGFIRPDDSSVENVKALGGWGQIKYQFTKKWSSTLGGGADIPDEETLLEGGDMRTKNTFGFLNFAYSPVDPLIFMLEGEYLKTEYQQSDAGSNVRIQFVTYYKF